MTIKARELTCDKTREALQVACGLPNHMRVVSMGEGERVAHIARGRLCINCGLKSIRFVVIPTRKTVEILCLGCLEAILLDADNYPEVDEDEALKMMAGLQELMEATSA